jgi:hypothetical protein
MPSQSSSQLYIPIRSYIKDLLGQSFTMYVLVSKPRRRLILSLVLANCRVRALRHTRQRLVTTSLVCLQRQIWVDTAKTNAELGNSFWLWDNDNGVYRFILHCTCLHLPCVLAFAVPFLHGGVRPLNNTSQEHHTTAP